MKPPIINRRKIILRYFYLWMIFISWFRLSYATLSVDATPASTTVNAATTYDFSIQGVSS